MADKVTIKKGNNAVTCYTASYIDSTFLKKSDISSQTIGKAGLLQDASNSSWSISASWMHASKSSVGLDDYLTLMEGVGNSQALIYTVQARNVKVGSAANADTALKYTGTDYYLAHGTNSILFHSTEQSSSPGMVWGYNSKADAYPYKVSSLSVGSASMLTGLGNRNDNTGWGTTTAKNGYTVRFGVDMPGGGGLVFSEKDGKTYVMIDGTVFVNEGNSEIAKKSDIPVDIVKSIYFNGSTYYPDSGKIDLGTVISAANSMGFQDHGVGYANVYVSADTTTYPKVFIRWGSASFASGSAQRQVSVTFAQPMKGTYRPAGSSKTLTASVPQNNISVIAVEHSKSGYGGSSNGSYYNAIKTAGASTSGFSLYLGLSEAIAIDYIAIGYIKGDN